MSYQDPHDQWIETITGMVIVAFFFWLVFFLVRDVIVASPL